MTDKTNENDKIGTKKSKKSLLDRYRDLSLEDKYRLIGYMLFFIVIWWILSKLNLKYAPFVMPGQP
jgi:hypothetical protein